MAVSQAEYDKLREQKSKLAAKQRDAEAAKADSLKRGGLRFLSDTISDAGSATAGLAGAADLPIDGEKVAMAVGFLGRAIRPFVNPLGVADQVLSFPDGLWKGGLAVATFKSRVRKNGWPGAEGA